MECPAEEEQECVRLNLECADLCFAAATLAEQPAKCSAEQLLEVFTRAADACNACAMAYERHRTRLDSCIASAHSCQRCREVLILAMQDVGGESGLIQTN